MWSNNLRRRRCRNQLKGGHCLFVSAHTLLSHEDGELSSLQIKVRVLLSAAIDVFVFAGMEPQPAPVKPGAALCS